MLYAVFVVEKMQHLEKWSWKAMSAITWLGFLGNI